MPDSVTVIFEDKIDSITFLCFMARTFFVSIKTSNALKMIYDIRVTTGLQQINFYCGLILILRGKS